MNHANIENWALSVLDRVTRKQPNEDARVELKAAWPTDPGKAARRIAGHANAARGSPVLWIIGLDEEVGVKPLQHTDFAMWWKQVQSHFDAAMAPRPIDLIVPTPGGPMVAVMFETDRAPFVVKNPKYGQPGETVRYEVPWREGTQIQSATRTELLKLLVPSRSIPHVEVLGGELSAETEAENESESVTVTLKVQVFIEQDGPRVVLPRHKCGGALVLSGGERIELGDVSLAVFEPGHQRGSFATSTIACFAEPGVLEVESMLQATPSVFLSEVIQVDLKLAFVGMDGLQHESLLLRRVASAYDVKRMVWSQGFMYLPDVDKYKVWVDAVVEVLMQGNRGNTVTIGHESQEWAARAVREGRLSWGYSARSVTLPREDVDG